MNRRLIFRGVVAFLLVFVSPAFAQQFVVGNETRVALVVGVGNYAFDSLPNPVNDAVDVGSALRRLGFDTTVLIDPSRKNIFEALESLDRTLARPNSVGLFFFAGHGAQVVGRNYLIPVDAVPTSESDVLRFGVDLYEVIRRFANARSSMNLIFLDSCRTNASTPWHKLAAQGLAPIEAPKGTLIAYATAPGSFALDGAGRNGTFTSALLRHIETPGAPIEEVMKKIRNEVARETLDMQIPWENTSLTRDFYFAPRRTGSRHPTEASDVSIDEERAWGNTKDAISIYELLGFVKRYPNSRHVEEAVTSANRILAKLKAPNIDADDLRAMTQGEVRGGVESTWLGARSLAERGLDYREAPLVVDVQPGLPGDKAGIKAGDILLEVNGIRLSSRAAHEELRRVMRPGELVEFLILRGTSRHRLVGITDRSPIEMLLGHAGGERMKTKRDINRAASYFQYVNENGHWQGALAMGMLYVTGKGVQRDVSRGMSLLSQAADTGSLYAKTYLGLMFLGGRDVGYDTERGCRMIERGFQIGMPEGAYGRGVCLINGYSGGKDVRGGLELVRKAAEDGYVPAQNLLKKIEKKN